MQVTSEVTVGSATSADGTVIGYRSVGSGPGLLVIPGSPGMAADFDAFAAAVADRFTVHVIERRGRGTSGPQGDSYSVETECADIEAVRTATASRFVFGHSFGGFLTLESALRDSGFEKVVVYEPGVSIDGSIPFGWADECRRLVAAGKRAEAFLSFIQGVNPETSGKAPRWLLRIIIPLAIKKPERLQKYALLETVIREHALSSAQDGDFPKYSRITSPVLLMAGKDVKTTGPGRAAPRLHETLAGSELRLFPKLDHFGPEKDPAGIGAAVAAFCLGAADTR